VPGSNDSAVRVVNNYIIRNMYELYSQNTTIFSHRIIHWVYNYMFRPCILAIVRLYCRLNKQLYNMCVGYPTVRVSILGYRQ